MVYPDKESNFLFKETIYSGLSSWLMHKYLSDAPPVAGARSDVFGMQQRT
jgi:hypothetical protein